MKKVGKLFCQFAELSYLCTRFRKIFRVAQFKKRSLTYCKTNNKAAFRVSQLIRDVKQDTSIQDTMDSVKSGRAWDRDRQFF